MLEIVVLTNPDFDCGIRVRKNRVTPVKIDPHHLTYSDKLFNIKIDTKALCNRFRQLPGKVFRANFGDIVAVWQVAKRDRRLIQIVVNVK